jgi:hypothetical protein
MDQKAVLLSTIESALQLQSPPAPLSADHVNRLGRQLGLTDQQTFEFIRQLSAEDEIDLAWGGTVRAVRRHKPSIYLGPNATYIAENVQFHAPAAVGAGASIRISNAPEQDRAEIVAALTAALDKLTAESARISDEHQRNYQQLADLTRTIQQELLAQDKNDKLDKPEASTLTQNLEKANKTLDAIEKAEKLGTSVAPHLPYLWNLLHHAYAAVSTYLGGS